MKLLALDTSSSACSVALLDTDKPLNLQVTSMHQVMPMQQGRLILPMIQALLAAASLTLNQLDAIAYGCGPGSFTGIRIASTVVQGIGFVSIGRVIPISSLAAIAQAAYLARQWGSLLVALDARIGEVYWARYVVNEHGCMVLQGEEEICDPLEVSIPANPEGWVGVGDGWGKYEEILKKRLGGFPQLTHPEWLPTAEAVLSLARIKFNQGYWVTPREAVPVYLR